MAEEAQTKEQLVRQEQEETPKAAASGETAGSEGPPAFPGMSGWLPFVAAAGGLAGATAIVYAMGGIIMWLRLGGAGVEANQALGAIPQQTLFAVGAQQLVLPAVAGIIFFTVTLLIERTRGRGDGKEQSGASAEQPEAEPAKESGDEPRGRLRRVFRPIRRAITKAWQSRPGRAVRRVVRLLLVPIVVPIKWYFKYVPDLLIAWLPIFLFLPNPQETVIFALIGTCSAGIADWSTHWSGSSREVALRIAVALAVLNIGAGIAFELVHPKSLPKVVLRSGEQTQEAQFIAVNGGNAYLVEHSRLTIVPSSSYERLTVKKGETEELHSPSIFDSVWPF